MLCNSWILTKVSPCPSRNWCLLMASVTKENQKCCSPGWVSFWPGFVQVLNDHLLLNQPNVSTLFCHIKGEVAKQSSQPGRNYDLVHIFRVRVNVQLATDVKHVEKAQGELVFFHDWMLALVVCGETVSCLYGLAAVAIRNIIIMIQSKRFSCFLSHLSEYVLCKNVCAFSKKI